MIRPIIAAVLLLLIAGSAATYFTSLERRIKEVQQHAASNSTMQTRTEFILHQFVEMAPRELERMALFYRCKCGHDDPRKSIATTDNSE